MEQYQFPWLLEMTKDRRNSNRSSVAVALSCSLGEGGGEDFATRFGREALPVVPADSRRGMGVGQSQPNTRARAQNPPPIYTFLFHKEAMLVKSQPSFTLGLVEISSLLRGSVKVFVVTVQPQA